MKKLSIFLFFSLQINYAQAPDSVYAIEELRFIATRISKIQLDYDNLYFYSDRKSTHNNEKKSYFDFIFNFPTSLLSFSNFSTQQTKLFDSYLHQNTVLQRSYVFIFNDIREYHGNSYILAINSRGLIYYLKGFRDENFNDLMHDEEISISNLSDALSVAKLYLETVKRIEEYESIIIEKGNINSYLSQYDFLKEPYFSKIGETGMLSFFTIIYTLNIISYHLFEFEGAAVKKYEVISFDADNR
jgi:hypothetical protein